MNDLISREEAIKAVKFYETFCDPYPRVIEALEQLPPVQSRKGKWLKAGTRMGIPLFECSLCECGDEVPTVMGKPSYNFCPYCGADMREGDVE